MPGPSHLPATSGRPDARTSRGNIGGTPDNNTTHRPGLRRARVHPGVRRDPAAAPAAPGTRLAAEGAGATPELHDGGPELAGVGAARLAVSVMARAVLFALLGMMAWALLPFALGWSPTTVMTGSMEPRISAGDVVITRPIPTGTAALSHILLVDDPDHANKLRLHRYVEDAPDGSLILRGDANQSNDSSPVTPESVHGVAVLRIPYVGLPVVWIAEKNWGNLAAVFVAVSALTLAAVSGSSAAPRSRQDPARTGATRGPQRPTQAHTARRATRRRVRATTRRARTIRAVLSLAALPVLVTPQLLMAAPSQAAFSAAAPTQASSFTSLSSYPCLSRPVEDNPYLFYSFNEASGATADDTSGNARTGTLHGPTSRVKGSCVVDDSPALRLDGSTSHVSTPTRLSSAPNTFTLEIWFKTETTKGGRLMGLGNLQTGASSVADRHLYMTTTGAVTFGVGPANGDGPSVITSPGRYNDGAWHQATVTMSPSWDYDRSTGGIVLPGISLFIDGRWVASDLGVTAGPSYAGYWRVGYDNMTTMNNKTVAWPGAPTNRSFEGTIDNAAVYGAALDSAQILAHEAASR